MTLSPIRIWWVSMWLSSTEGLWDGPSSCRRSRTWRRTWQVTNTAWVCCPALCSCSLITKTVLQVKRYVRKGVPNEHRARIWMAASGAQERLESNPGYYRSLLATEHDAKLKETIQLGAKNWTVSQEMISMTQYEEHRWKWWLHGGWVPFSVFRFISLVMAGSLKFLGWQKSRNHKR